MSQVGWVPEHERNTVWYLFNPLFQVRVNPRDVQSAEDIKRYGTPSTGNTMVDEEMDKNEHIVMWCVARMEAFYNAGYPVKLVRREDCDQVYKLVNDHLTAMNFTLVQSENFSNDPQTMEELIRLDNFADAVYEHARWGLKSNLQHAAFARRAHAKNPFAKLTEMTRRNRTAAPAVEAKPGASSSGRKYGIASDAGEIAGEVVTPETAQVTKPSEDGLPKRVSLANMFEERRQMGLRWK